MQLRKYRWSRAYESAEEELAGFLRQRKIQAERQIAEPGEAFDSSQASDDMQFFCAEGSIKLSADGQQFSLQPGDALDLPANTTYDIFGGLTGAVWYEALAPNSGHR